PFESPEDFSSEAYWHARERARQQQAHGEEQARRRQERHQSHDQGQQRGQDGDRQHSRDHAGASQRRGAPPGERTLRALHVLGLEAGATRSEIKQAYRRLAQAHHPDRFFALGERDVASASMRFQKIKKAYEYLMQDARSL
ncbi:MAG: J domain-containing protein, partial [Halomonas sp.]|nr:J domain-containing protein [Halomonas sp.]